MRHVQLQSVLIGITCVASPRLSEAFNILDWWCLKLVRANESFFAKTVQLFTKVYNSRWRAERNETSERIGRPRTEKWVPVLVRACMRVSMKVCGDGFLQ